LKIVGEIRLILKSSILPSKRAIRPSVNEGVMRGCRSRLWGYHEHSTGITNNKRSQHPFQ